MNWNPEEYARNSSAQLTWARELIDRLKLDGSETVLDVGCGDGKITAEFVRVLPDGFVLGTDSSPAFIDYARSHYPPERFPNLRFEMIDARQLSSDRSFDLIFSNAALHWVDDHLAFLSGCARLLRPGGRLVVSCGGKGNAADIIAVLESIIRQPTWSNYFTDFEFPYYFYSPQDYRPLLDTAGLRANRLELVEKDMIHSGREEMAGWIRTTWLPYLQRVPVHLREKLIDEVVEAYLAINPLDDKGRSHVRMIRLELEAAA